MKILSWILRIVAAAILAQTLFFKFTAHPDSVAIFTAIGMEPEGRILIGVLELIAAVLLLVPGTVAFVRVSFDCVGLFSGGISDPSTPDPNYPSDVCEILVLGLAGRFCKRPSFISIHESIRSVY
jgi:hypothetical protein